MVGLVALAAHLLLMLALAPGLVGLLRWQRARLLGRVGPPVLQPWRDLLRLARKQQVLAENTSFLFAAAPVVAFAATLAAAALVPGFALGMATAPLSDLLALAGLLALARIVLALAALDTGTACGGLGASRETGVAVFAEPALLLVILTLALLAGSTNLDAIAAALRDTAVGLRLPLGLALLASLAVALAANGRVPAGSPDTSLELAMTGEAMALEYSGPRLALVEWTAGLRLLLWLTLIGTLFFPFGTASPAAGPLVWLLALPAWVLKLAVLAVALGLLEAGLAVRRVVRLPELLGAALLLCVLAVVLVLLGQGVA